MLRRDPGFTVLYDDHRSTDSSTITCDVHGAMMVIDVYRDELGCPTGSSQFSEVVDESHWKMRDTDETSVDVDHVYSRAIQLVASHQGDICGRIGVSDDDRLPWLDSDAPSTPSISAILMMGSSSTSVVICVIKARFLTSPHASPSGVSLGHNIPH